MSLRQSSHLWRRNTLRLWAFPQAPSRAMWIPFPIVAPYLKRASRRFLSRHWTKLFLVIWTDSCRCAGGFPGMTSHVLASPLALPFTVDVSVVQWSVSVFQCRCVALQQLRRTTIFPSSSYHFLIHQFIISCPGCVLVQQPTSVFQGLRAALQQLEKTTPRTPTQTPSSVLFVL